MKKVQEIKKEIRRLEGEKNNIIGGIQSHLEEGLKEYIEEVKVSFWTNEIDIYITPKYACSEVLSIEITKDNISAKTSSGGWEDDTKMIPMFAGIFNFLNNNLYEMDLNNKTQILRDIERKIYKLEDQIIELEKRVEIEKFEREHKKIDIKEYLQEIKKGMKLVCYKIDENIRKYEIEFYKKRFRVNDVPVAKNKILESFKNCYIKGE